MLGVNDKKLNLLSFQQIDDGFPVDAGTLHGHMCTAMPKNDPKDALTIADSVSRGFYYEYTRQSHEFQRLKTLMSDREFWVTNSVRLQNRIVRWLDIRFPEYPSVFKDWTCKRSLATLKTFPCPQDLEKHTVSDVISAWRVHMQRAGGTTGTEKAAQLIAQAKRSVGERVAVDEAKADLKRLIEEFERVTSMLEQIEKDIEALLSEIPMAQQLRTIKGLGKIFTAAILAGTGDLRQYAHGRQVLRKAGLNLAQSTSGKRKGQIVLSKRGDSACENISISQPFSLFGITLFSVICMNIMYRKRR
ncbi:hypothetical protein FHT67_006015 [Paenibacillus sp. BK720]|nr:hypothetical protein [Paenibacillus sp. BK720]